MVIISRQISQGIIRCKWLRIQYKRTFAEKNRSRKEMSKKTIQKMTSKRRDIIMIGFELALDVSK
jgi:hypothetical protein